MWRTKQSLKSVILIFQICFRRNIFKLSSWNFEYPHPVTHPWCASHPNFQLYRELTPECCGGPLWWVWVTRILTLFSTHPHNLISPHLLLLQMLIVRSKEQWFKLGVHVIVSTLGCLRTKVNCPCSILRRNEENLFRRINAGYFSKLFYFLWNERNLATSET